MASDAELIQQTLDGDQSGFASLIERYQPQILALCHAWISNPQDAEELAQDTFLCAYQKLEKLRDREKFLPWLSQIARNRCKMYLRRDFPRASSQTAPSEQEVNTHESNEKDAVDAELAEFEKLLEEWDIEEALAVLSQLEEETKHNTHQTQTDTEPKKIPKR